MKKAIDDVAIARGIIRKLLVVLYKVKPYEESNSSYKVNHNSEDVDTILSRYEVAFDKYYKSSSKANKRNQYILRLSFLIREYKKLEGETKVSLLAKNKDPMILASALDSMREFTNYLVETINEDRNNQDLAPYKKPLFNYKMK